MTEKQKCTIKRCEKEAYASFKLGKYVFCKEHYTQIDHIIQAVVDGRVTLG